MDYFHKGSPQKLFDNSQINPKYPIQKIKSSFNLNNETIKRESENQRSFDFNTVKFFSNFDSGNLASVEKINDNTFNLDIGYDCMDTDIDRRATSYKIWFYFAVKSSINQNITITIKNLNNFLRLWKSGYKIAYRELDSNFISVKQFESSYTENEEELWKRFPNEIQSTLNPDTKQVEITWEYDYKPNIFVLFAFCYPWSYTKHLKFLDYLEWKMNFIPKIEPYQSNSETINQSQNRIYVHQNHFLNNTNDQQTLSNLSTNNNLQNTKNSNIYFHKDILTYTKEKRFLHLITITSKKNISQTVYEPKINGLFPNTNQCKRNYPERPIVFITARVHPGETPGSFMMNGLLKLLISQEDKNAEMLRDNFVFKIIPMLNPDGVSHGHFRLDRSGHNLNRSYLNPDIKKDPEIFAVKKMFLLYNNIYKVRYYFDLHADMNVNGVYAFGNAINDFGGHVENVLFGYIFSINCQNVNWPKCVFNESSMKTKCKLDKYSKEATSRVNFYKTTGIIHAYTIESTYNKGNFKDTLLNNADFFINDFCNIGKELLISILDYEDLHISDRLHNNEYKTLDDCRYYIADFLCKTDERFKNDPFVRELANYINKDKKWQTLNEINTRFIEGVNTDRINRNKHSIKEINSYSVNNKFSNKKLNNIQPQSRGNRFSLPSIRNKTQKFNSNSVNSNVFNKSNNLSVNKYNNFNCKLNFNHNLNCNIRDFGDKNNNDDLIPKTIKVSKGKYINKISSLKPNLNINELNNNYNINTNLNSNLNTNSSIVNNNLTFTNSKLMSRTNVMSNKPSSSYNPNLKIGFKNVKKQDSNYINEYSKESAPISNNFKAKPNIDFSSNNSLWKKSFNH